MAGVFADSFAHYSFSQILRKWTYATSFNGSLVSGRDGRTGLSIVSGLVTKTVPHQASYISGVAMMYVNAPGGTIMVHTHVNTQVVRLNLLPDGTLAAYIGYISFLIGNSTNALHANTFYYIEMKSSISGGKGDPITATVVVHVDGEEWINQTQSAGNINDLVLQKATMNGVSLGVASFIGGTIYNDLYVCNTQGANNDFLGDVIIEAIFANGDHTIEFSPAGVHFSRINEQIADDDSSTVFSNTAGQYDIYDWTDIPTFEGTIPFVHYGICARKDKEGLRSIIPIVAGPSVEVGDEQFLNQDYVYYFVPMDSDPADGGWTVDQFNNEIFGFKIKT